MDDLHGVRYPQYFSYLALLLSKTIVCGGISLRRVFALFRNEIPVLHIFPTSGYNLAYMNNSRSLLYCQLFLKLTMLCGALGNNVLMSEYL